MARRGETLELAVLGLLHESPMQGYQLRKQVDEVLGRSRLLSYRSLYPALKRMLRAGWIAEHVTTPESGTVSRRIPAASGSITGAGNRFSAMPNTWLGIPNRSRRTMFGGVRTDSVTLAPAPSRSSAISVAELPAPTTSTSCPAYDDGSR